MDQSEGFNELPEVALRMDEALEGLGENAAMVLSELNGFLCGVLLSPEPIPDEEWVREIWDSEDANGPFASTAEASAFRTLVKEYKQSIEDELIALEFEPIFDVDSETGDVIWEIWTIGLSRAFDLRPDSWSAYMQEGENEEASDAFMNLVGLIAIADPEDDQEEAVSEEDMEEVNEAAPDIIPFSVTALYHAGERGTHPSHLDS